MDLKDELKAGADKCVDEQRTSADHVIGQAFFAGVSWYMAFLRQKAAERSDPTNIS